MQIKLHLADGILQDVPQQYFRNLTHETCQQILIGLEQEEYFLGYFESPFSFISAIMLKIVEGL